MIQEIITYMIISGAVVVFAVRTLSLFKIAGTKRSAGCSGCSADCSLKDNKLVTLKKCPEPQNIDIYL